MKHLNPVEDIQLEQLISLYSMYVLCDTECIPQSKGQLLNVHRFFKMAVSAVPLKPITVLLFTASWSPHVWGEFNNKVNVEAFSSEGFAAVVNTK